MSGKNKHQKRIDEFFENYPEENTCIVCSDGQIFTKKAEHWAKNHAKSSGLKVEEVDRPGTSKDEGGSSDETENTTPDFSKMKKAELKAYAKKNDIKIKDGTNPEIIKQIEDFLDASFDPDKVEEVDGSESEENEEGEFTPTKTEK